MNGDNATIRAAADETGAGGNDAEHHQRIRQAARAGGTGQEDARATLAKLRAAAGEGNAASVRRYRYEADEAIAKAVSPQWRRIRLEPPAACRQPHRPEKVIVPSRRPAGGPHPHAKHAARAPFQQAPPKAIQPAATLSKAQRKPAIEAPLDLATMPALTKGFALRDALAGAVRAGRVQATPRALAAFAQANARLDPDEAAEEVERFLACVQHHRKLRRRMKV